MPFNNNHKNKPYILIVDDTPADINVLKDALISNYIVRLATNGLVAMRAAHVLPHPDLILLDIVMPGLDGYEVCRRFKADPAIKDIPIIFVSGKADETDEVEGLKLGAVDYITKPFSMPIILTRIETHIRLRRQHNILETVRSVQERFIGEASDGELFEGLLADLIGLTESAIGLIGETLKDTSGSFMQLHAVSNIAWNEETQQLYAKCASGELRLNFLNNLFGAVLTQKAPVISNDPATDPRAKGFPSGHPAISSFMGLPLWSGGEIVGMIGLANRKGGYDPGMIPSLQLVMSVCAQLLVGFRERKARALAEEQLRVLNQELELRVAERTLELCESNIRLEREVAERAAAQEALQRQESFLEAILNNIRDGVLACDAHGTITLANAAMDRMYGEKITGRSLEQWIGQCQFMQADDTTPLPVHEHPLFRVLQENSSLQDWEVLVGLKQEDPRWFLINAQFMPTLQEQKTGMVISISDITERKRAEREHIARQAAESANLAKSEFLATMSHEIRTPMNVVLGMAEVLLETDPNPEQLHFIQTMHHSGKALLTLINDILDFSRIEAGILHWTNTPSSPRRW